MDHELLIRYISSLGFPIASAIGLGYVLWRLGRDLAAAHVAYLKENTVEMKKQTEELKKQTPILQSIIATMPTLCVADAEQLRRRTK